jgi:hypothetical protein
VKQNVLGVKEGEREAGRRGRSSKGWPLMECGVEGAGAQSAGTQGRAILALGSRSFTLASRAASDLQAGAADGGTPGGLRDLAARLPARQDRRPDLARAGAPGRHVPCASRRL